MLSYPLFEHPPYTLALASRLCQIAAEQALDIVHMHYAIPHTVSAYLARELRRAIRGTDRISPIVRKERTMLPKNRILLGFSLALAFVLTVCTGWPEQKSKEQEKRTNVKLPAAVAKAVKDNRPTAEIDKIDVEKDAGVTLYDIEFKSGQGEIDIAEAGTVMDIATIIEMKDVPPAAAAAIQKAVRGAKISQLEKSEIRAEVKNGKIMKLANPKYAYEAELVKGNQTAEVQVSPDGKILEAPKWKTEAAKEK